MKNIVTVEKLTLVLMAKKTNASTRALDLITSHRYGVGKETIAALIKAINEVR